MGGVRRGMAAGVVFALGVVGASAAAARSADPEPPFPVVVAAGADRTVAVTPDGAWRVELPWLLPGDSDPSVSPDGGRIAFVSRRDGASELYVATASTGAARRLTRSAVADRAPDWSPDGRRIVWSVGRRGDLHVIDLASGTRRVLTRGPDDDSDPSWSRDGTTIAFSSDRGGDRGLWRISAAGGVAEPLVDSDRPDTHPTWSPTGRALAFARGNQVAVYDLAANVITIVASGRTRVTGLAWSPGGGELAASWTGQPAEAAIVNIDGGPVRAVARTKGLVVSDWADTRRALVPRPDELLPDLDQRTPLGVQVARRDGRWVLAFDSSTENLGIGPLVVHGTRAPGARSMRADQLVERDDALPLVIRSIGALHYELHEPHYHWHLQDFVRYELRTLAGELVGRDRKTGFCLIDRYGRTKQKLDVGPPRFIGDCGTGKPEARTVVEGSSVGYIDRYPAGFHGQEIPLAGVPAGRYLLVHRANPERRIRELEYADDVASALIELRWPGGPSGRPVVRVVRHCEQGARCGTADGP